MSQHDHYFQRVCGSARRALSGQTPGTLRAYSFALDVSAKRIYLRAHFGEKPSEDDLEDISIVETEIDADFMDDFEAETEIEIVALGTPLSFLSDGIAYLREGEIGELCCD